MADPTTTPPPPAPGKARQAQWPKLALRTLSWSNQILATGRNLLIRHISRPLTQIRLRHWKRPIQRRKTSSLLRKKRASDGFFKRAESKLPDLFRLGKLCPPLQPTPQRKIAHQEAEEREPSQRYTTFSLPLWVSLYPQEKNSPEQKSGRFCLGKETTRRRF